MPLVTSQPDVGHASRNYRPRQHRAGDRIAGDSVHEVAEIMRAETVGSAIVERDSEPVGIVTDRDLAMEVLAEGEDPLGMTVRDVMTTDPVTADVDDGVFELCEMMRERGVRRMPVVDDGKLAGIVTLDDLIVLLEDEMNDLSEVIREESPPYQTS